MRLVTYNVEWFDALFDDDGNLLEDQEWSARRNITRREQLDALGLVFQRLDADAIMIIEAPDTNRRRSTEKALVNFHSRAFGGLGRPRSGSMWRLLGWRIGRVLQNLGATVRTRTGFAAAWKRVVRWRLARRDGRNNKASTTA